jgi:hypothetical protein
MPTFARTSRTCPADAPSRSMPTGRLGACSDDDQKRTLGHGQPDRDVELPSPARDADDSVVSRDHGRRLQLPLDVRNNLFEFRPIHVRVVITVPADRCRASCLRYALSRCRRTAARVSHPSCRRSADPTESCLANVWPIFPEHRLIAGSHPSYRPQNLRVQRPGLRC